MSAKGIFLCQLGARRYRQILASSSVEQLKKTSRHAHLRKLNTGVEFRATAAVPTVKQPKICITNTFPTSHQSLKIAFRDNLAADYQYIWLRDNCQCTKCVHPGNKQKLLDTVSLDINIKPKSYHLKENGNLNVVWPPERNSEEHISEYDAEWLHKYGKGFQLSSHDIHHGLPALIPWTADKITSLMPEISYDEVMETEEGLEILLDHIYKYGIAIIRGVPCQKGQVIKVMERVAYIKRTKWGSSFDVLCEPVQSDPGHLAYTGMYLEHHTDMNYLEKSPGLQALHCLKANPAIDGDSIGGQSFFVDGFYIANWLRKIHPASFHALTSTLVEFSIQSHNMEYSNNQYVLCANPANGEVFEIHYNTRTMAPIKGPAESVQPFYEAYRLLGQKMREKSSEFAFNLAPGDLVAFNNRRVLHGRTSFDPSKMSRHLEGAYGDIDEVITRYKSMVKGGANKQ